LLFSRYTPERRLGGRWGRRVERDAATRSYVSMPVGLDVWSRRKGEGETREVR
jgi:hypothetical protein